MRFWIKCHLEGPRGPRTGSSALPPSEGRAFPEISFCKARGPSRRAVLPGIRVRCGIRVRFGIWDRFEIRVRSARYGSSWWLRGVAGLVWENVVGERPAANRQADQHEHNAHN